MNGEIRVLSDPVAVAEEATHRCLAMMAKRPGKRFSLALSGGSTPQRFYRRLSEPSWHDRIDWNLLHIFLVDERFLPLDHADSNFRMIRETLLAHVPIPPSNIHPMPTDGTPEDCAQRYERELRMFFGDGPARFDLVLLGMGADGHTASSFPGHVHSDERWVFPVHDSPKPPSVRLSLGFELINQAHHVLFLVTGQDKAEALDHLRQSRQPLLPAGRVKLGQGELAWLVDEAAWNGGASK
ncbi:MAG: 6-phosphogluconolactonase [Methylococcaceae bacterium]|nr:6-phosphogluconolactonase [Methylococcaceae bacterium]